MQQLEQAEARLGLRLPWEVRLRLLATPLGCRCCSRYARVLSVLCCSMSLPTACPCCLQLWELLRFRAGQLPGPGVMFADSCRLLGELSLQQRANALD